MELICQHSDDDQDSDCNSHNNPTIASIAQLAKHDGKLLDKKQFITFEMICCTFLLQFVNEALDPSSSIYKHIGIAASHDDHSKFIDDVKEQLLTCEGMYQSLLFLMGPAGAGKTTVIRAAEQFCYELCSSCNILRLDTSFFYKAYTRSAAPAFGGGTNIKASD